MNFLNSIFAALAILSLALLLWQFFAARKFPLHKRIVKSDFAPAISILKPLKGCDDTTTESLQSWFTQSYTGQIQILFGVADVNDPVCEIVKSLIQQFPQSDAQLIVCPENLGANAKVSTLAQLEKLTKHDLILISDADVRVPPDFLANFVAPLRDEKVGLANCFYRLANPTTTAMQCEAIAINTDFWSQVLQSQTLKPLDFALGAAILLRRKNLEQIGGFKSLANCLADDYQLGNRISKNGHLIALCPIVVECWDSPANWRDVWKHQLRWARTIRVCQPLPYFFSILSNVSLWAVLWLIASATQFLFTLREPDFFNFFELKIISLESMMIVTVILLARVVIAQNLQHRFTPERKLVSPFWLVPVKDLLHAAIWFCAFAGNTVEWRGKKMKLRSDGTLCGEN